MKIFAIFLFCIITFHGYAQENEMNQLLSIQNYSVLEIKNTCSNPPCFLEDKTIPFSEEITDDFFNSSITCASPKFLSLRYEQQFNNIKKMMTNQTLIFETYTVCINIINGYSFHVADYNDGTRIVTCLNGGMRGLQGVAVYGVKTAESNIVEWHNDYFIHYYPNGEVYSYIYKQAVALH